MAVSHEACCIRRANVPATEVELDDRHKSINRVVNVGHWEESIGMCHEACGH